LHGKVLEALSRAKKQRNLRKNRGDELLGFLFQIFT
jgi:hypothetical protein